MWEINAYENIYQTHSEQILNRIMEDYNYSKKTYSEFTKDEIALFSKGKKLKKEKKWRCRLVRSGYENFNLATRVQIPASSPLRRYHGF